MINTLNDKRTFISLPLNKVWKYQSALGFILPVLYWWLYVTSVQLLLSYIAQLFFMWQPIIFQTHLQEGLKRFSDRYWQEESSESEKYIEIHSW